MRVIDSNSLPVSGPSNRPDELLFDAVLFDLDGTLVATDRFWVQAARTGARRAFRTLGLEREIPGAEAWMQLVGHPLAVGFERLFSDLTAEQRATVMHACEEEEHRLLAEGHDALMPGAKELLTTLTDAGLRLGAASNCSQSYLDHWMTRCGLSRWIREPRCLDSPGVRDKAGMIEDILLSFGTRDAVFVGDRAGDRDAAWANGLPHVHCAFGFAARGERVPAEGRIEDLGELLELLGERTAAADRVLDMAGLLRPAAAPPLILGVAGAPLSGRSSFAGSLARRLEHHGFGAAVVPLAWFEAESPGTASLDLERCERELLEPYRKGQPVRLENPGRLPRNWDPAEAGAPIEIDPDDVLLLVGDGLLAPRLRSRLDRLFWLEVDPAILLRRAVGREGRFLGTAALDPVRSVWARVADEIQVHRPEHLADVIVAADNPLTPKPRQPSARSGA